MTTKAEFTDQWSDVNGHTPVDRRARLNELGALLEKTDDEQREHDALATMVAEDEDITLREQDENAVS